MKRTMMLALVAVAGTLSEHHLAPPVAAAPSPTSVTIAGSLQSELGCPGDWDPACPATHLAFDADDDVWQGTFTVPAGSYEYKAALDDSWTENYGLYAQLGGANIPLSLASGQSVKFYYDHKTHWVTDNRSSVIATVPGSFQSELGCPGDWQPDCLRSWLQDPDGDGTYTLTATGVPAGNYEAKVAINESWDENYGQGGVQNGTNIPFSVPPGSGAVTFSYDAATHVLTIAVAVSGSDNNVEWDGLRHDSRDPLYRSPGGAVPAGTTVRIRFRTFHRDVTGVSLRVYDVNAAGEQLIPMNVAASDMPCYQSGLGARTCDFWEATVQSATPNNLWYRFIATDGTDTDYYADNTPALDGGLGAPGDSPIDQSYALMFHAPAFTAPAWARQGVIYQVFPDRFRNGRANNDASTGDPRYDDPVLALPWGTLPEGYCRNYADAATNCAWRFDGTPPSWSPDIEGPRGRDYFGGDLKGVDQKLHYLQALGVNTLYLNPIFDAGSNHGYDTQDYLKIDPSFGTQKDWEDLAKHTTQRGMRILLDGVFNHLSSDSKFFDRYHRYATDGACELAASPYRPWFYFRPPAGAEAAPCAASGAGNDTYYNGWFGFDSIPVLNKGVGAVVTYFLTGQNSVSRHWLNAGASGWRLDVMGDSSFPSGYWTTFRGVVKGTRPDALIVGELWQKDSTLLRFLRGDRADATMNYRLRDAIVGFLAPGPFDSKGFADSGRIISASEFAARLSSIREDYPDAAYYSLMNLLDSHDTERVLWTLTPGTETWADKEANPVNLAEGKRRLRLASLVQFFMPGAPTIYYGDEVGMTGDDDPDDRRTYPWTDVGGTPDGAIFKHYQALIATRMASPALIDGDFRALLADDAGETVALGRKTGHQAAVLVINRSATPQTVAVPVTGYLPEGAQLTTVYGVGNPAGSSTAVTGGAISLALNGRSGVLLTSGHIDLTPPGPPSGLQVTSEANGRVSLAWSAAPDAAGYNVYQSRVSGGGYLEVASVPAGTTTATIAGLPNGITIYFVVKGVDGSGNESAASNEASGMAHYQIGWANLQWPPSLTHTISVLNRTDNIYGQVWIDGVTNQPGATPGLRAQVGFGPAGSDPANSSEWTWIDAGFNVDAGNNDEFVGSLLPEAVGMFDYVYRYSTTNGGEWLYADLNGPVAGSSPTNPGRLTVSSSGDTTAPSVPTGLSVVSASPSGITIDWNAVVGDPTLFGYEVLRSGTAGGPHSLIAATTATAFTDNAVSVNGTYYYVVRALDQSFNRSANSNEVSATAQLRTVTLTFNVTVPATTDATGRAVYIAGLLDRLDGGLPQWNPGGVVLARVDATHWTVTLTGKEDTQIEYKYTLGDWEHVEKGPVCDEPANRQLTLNYGATGAQTVNDTVANWRNVAPCGN